MLRSSSERRGRRLHVAALVGSLVAGLLLGPATAVLPSGAPAAAPRAEATPTHVGLIVASSPGSFNTACVPYSGGMTGLDVLGGRAVVGTSGPYAGFVFTIDGVGTKRPSDHVYWEYFEGNGSGGLTSSGLGAASTNPQAGSVEAWAYQNGSSWAPPGLTYSSICGGQDPVPQPAPVTTRAPATKPAATAAPPAPGGGALGGSTAAGNSSGAGGTGSTAPGTTNSSEPATTAAGSSNSTTSATSKPRSSTTGTSATASSSRVVAGASAPSPGTSAAGSSSTASSHHGSGGFPVGVVIAVLAMAVLGGLAFWQLRLRRG